MTRDGPLLPLVNPTQAQAHSRTNVHKAPLRSCNKYNNMKSLSDSTKASWIQEHANPVHITKVSPGPLPLKYCPFHVRPSASTYSPVPCIVLLSQVPVYELPSAHLYVPWP